MHLNKMIDKLLLSPYGATDINTLKLYNKISKHLHFLVNSNWIRFLFTNYAILITMNNFMKASPINDYMHCK